MIRSHTKHPRIEGEAQTDDGTENRRGDESEEGSQLKIKPEAIQIIVRI